MGGTGYGAEQHNFVSDVIDVPAIRFSSGVGYARLCCSAPTIVEANTAEDITSEDLTDAPQV